MEVTAKMVSELREQTGAGMMECKKALVEAEGDVVRAHEILRLRGKAGAEKRAGRAASDGVVAAATGDAGVALVELNSETDFVARNEEFRALAGSLAAIAAATSDDVEQVLGTSMQDGRPARIHVDEVVTKLRENIQFRRIVRFATSPSTLIASYIHTVNQKIGVLVELKADPSSEAVAEVAKGIAMHVAATKPTYLRREDVPADVLQREREVLEEITRNEGKPESAVSKIVEGRLGGFFEKTCLLEQPYVRESQKKISQLASEVGAEVIRFALFVVGQQ